MESGIRELIRQRMEKRSVDRVFRLTLRFCIVFWKVSDIISRMLSFYFFKQIRPDALFIRIAAVYCNEYWMYLLTALLVIFMVPSCCGSIVRY